MKNVVLSILIITLTIICVTIMLSEGDTETSNNIEIKQIHEDNSKIKIESTTEIVTKKENSPTKALKAVEKKDLVSIDTKKPDSNNKSLKQSSLEEMIIFKIPKQELLTSISKEDKVKILSIINKVSPTDYARINNYSKSEMRNNEAVNIMRILKTRLSDDDYRELREIAVRYIYIEKLEKVIGT